MTMTAAAMLARAQDEGVGDDNPAAKPRRRRFTAEYKVRILAEYDALTDVGAKGALLRREGLYTSHLAEWRRARELGEVRRLQPNKGTARSPEQVELERARRRIERLEDQLAKHRLALEIQGKASELLERLLAESDEDKRQP
jgi:transposase-like protein